MSKIQQYFRDYEQTLFNLRSKRSKITFKIFQTKIELGKPGLSSKRKIALKQKLHSLRSSRSKISYVIKMVKLNFNRPNEFTL